MKVIMAFRLFFLIFFIPFRFVLDDSLSVESRATRSGRVLWAFRVCRYMPYLVAAVALHQLIISWSLVSLRNSGL
jgi:hypothetical protein